MKASAYLVLVDTRKKKSGKYPVKVRVVYQRIYHDFKTGLDLDEDEFQQANLPKPKKEYRTVANQLNAIKEKMNHSLTSLKVFTFQKFEDAFYGTAINTSDLFHIYEEYINEVAGEQRIKTSLSYTTAMNSLKKFNPKLTINDIDDKLLKKYHNFLEQGGRSISTIGIYMRTLRAVYNYAITKKVIRKDEDYPFGKNKYSIPASNNIKKALTIEEVRSLFEFDTIPGSFQDRAKDFWILSYLCNGINFKDIALLKWKNIDGEMIRFVRQKTKRTSQSNQRIISCFIDETVSNIIKKWAKDKRDPDEYIFKIVEKSDTPTIQQKKIDQFVQNTNKNLKRICTAVGINKTVTTYFSRHSAATILKQSGASIETIQEALGHSSSLITQKYLDSFQDETKKQLSKTLNPFK
jgi:integrase